MKYRFVLYSLSRLKSGITYSVSQLNRVEQHEIILKV